MAFAVAVLPVEARAYVGKVPHSGAHDSPYSGQAQTTRSPSRSNRSSDPWTDATPTSPFGWPCTPTPVALHAGSYSFSLPMMPAMLQQVLVPLDQGSLGSAVLPEQGPTSQEMFGMSQWQSPASETPFAASNQWSALPAEATNAEPTDLPSLGSALHGTGNCRPCAWMWKARGCMNAASCDYCHLCPEGELKNRKRSKIAAIRSGALASSTNPDPRQGA
mmetsp:Transcript_95501/g.169575  ORF Transcript_95501/g.169575 Transcript_95501/m.169575 type:complete len:219 (+) Transcript_95501:48-704(+)|eukprot:CAMPEP_0197622562 /NCGR_PEP_ID=MMETSP1338-20131121/2817_1 /TAXON_ID=43686 ORGANISM="Pelagodinium beii, Strain RCC1491" /NCGR_SAMPLE_ID=MMETSP1338 /ASSEMBLY_ACC=CAM_ASM_000754 /LENGTH=218 /DNA_ID=CAMNT_0043192303 /DNA_START=43 /DNA_END=699 /DNA_ORIENTATION=-